MHAFFNACIFNTCIYSPYWGDVINLQLLQVVKVFMVTLEPYLTIIDEWLTNGHLNDPYSEFVIKK